MRLDENARLFFIRLAHLFAGCDGGIDEGLKISGFGDAHAVVADTAKARQRLPVGPHLARLTLTVQRLRHHDGKAVFSRTCGAAEDERVGKAPCSDGRPQILDCLIIAYEIGKTSKRAHINSIYGEIKNADGGRQSDPPSEAVVRRARPIASRAREPTCWQGAPKLHLSQRQALG